MKRLGHPSIEVTDWDEYLQEKQSSSSSSSADTESSGDNAEQLVNTSIGAVENYRDRDLDLDDTSSYTDLDDTEWDTVVDTDNDDLGDKDDRNLDPDFDPELYLDRDLGEDTSSTITDLDDTEW